MNQSLNIVAIENDERTASQIRVYLTELGEKISFQLYKSKEEFEKAYLSEARSELIRIDPISQHPDFKDTNYNQVTALLNFEAAKAEENILFEFVIKPPSGELQALDPNPSDAGAKIFGRSISAYLQGEVTLKGITVPQFQDRWDRIIDANEEEYSTLLPVLGKDQQLHLLKVTKAGHHGDHIKLHINDETQRLAPILTGENQRRKDEEALNGASKAFSHIDLLILRTACVTSRPLDWVNKTHQMLEKYKYTPPSGKIKIVLTKFEDDGVKKAELLHPVVEDLIFLPLDRLLFLQKLEIILSWPDQVRPSHLFSQSVGIEIEVAKAVSIERLSDIGIAIRNPSPLRKGLAGHFHFQLRKNLEFSSYAKVIQCKPHPDRNGQYLVYFSFFGIPRENISRIRQYLAEKDEYHSLISENDEDFEYHPENMFLEDQDHESRTVVVIDMDDAVLANTAEVIQSNIHQTEVVTVRSYTQFVHRYLAIAQNAEALASDNLLPATRDDFFSYPFTWSISTESGKFIKSRTPTTETDTILGFNAADFFNPAKDWKIFFQSQENLELLDELLRVCHARGEVEQCFVVNDKDGKPRVVKLKLRLVDDNRVSLSLETPEEKDFEHLDYASQPLSRVDAVVIDQLLVPGEFEDWHSQLTENLKHMGVLKGDSLPVILTCEEGKFNPDKYLQAQPQVLLVKPLDARRFLASVAYALKSKFTKYCLDNIGWQKINVIGHLAKPAKLTEISEFGGAIHLARPLAPGSILYLRGNMFDNAPDQSLCARFYCSNEIEDEKKQFENKFLYYGINESFLKYVRNWFRENYAARKRSD